jgi:diadenosine tetraphosphate (Ap4A) HIT family hydrolase
MNDCEFCLEFTNFPYSRIGKIYYSKIESRIIGSSENFVLLPTIGQIVPNSLLVIPKKHFETFSEIPYDQLEELQSFLAESVGLKECIFFEHGAKKISQSSCGVFHAHIHIIPLKHIRNIKSLVGNNALPAFNIEECFLNLREKNNYIIFKNIDGKYFYNFKENDSSELFTSQFFRKWLVQNYNKNIEWDWKKYNFVEEEVLNVVSALVKS